LSSSLLTFFFHSLEALTRPPTLNPNLSLSRKIDFFSGIAEKMQQQRLKQQQQALMQQALLQQQSLYHPGLLAPPQVPAHSLSFPLILCIGDDRCDFDSTFSFDFLLLFCF
jgi:hypothetical protein